MKGTVRQKNTISKEVIQVILSTAQVILAHMAS